MTNRFRVSSALIRRLENVGLQPLAVLRQAGLPMGLFDQERIFVTTEKLSAFCRGISEFSTDPAIGLKMATEERVERYDPVSIAALYAKTFRDALQRLARYKQLTCPEEIRIAERGDECALQFRWLLAEEKEPDFLIDVCFAWIVVLVLRVTWVLVNPKRVELQLPEAHGR